MILNSYDYWHLIYWVFHLDLIIILIRFVGEIKTGRRRSFECVLDWKSTVGKCLCKKWLGFHCCNFQRDRWISFPFSFKTNLFLISIWYLIHFLKKKTGKSNVHVGDFDVTLISLDELKAKLMEHQFLFVLCAFLPAEFKWKETLSILDLFEFDSSKLCISVLEETSRGWVKSFFELGLSISPTFSWNTSIWSGLEIF